MSGEVLSDYLSRERFIEHLRHELEIVRAERDRLRERVALLESVFVDKLDKSAKSYRELESHFTRLERLVFKVVIHECRVKRRPVTNDEIIKAFFSRFPFLRGKVKTETVTRRVRKLREDGYLVSPKRGFYHPKLEEDDG